MAEMLIQSESLTSIANEARTLSGTTNRMSPEVIADTIHTENTNFRTNISEQNNLIAQIQAALEGKAGNGNGIIPEGTITIEDNGTYNVTNYALAEVALPEAEQATPTISVSTNGLITASVTQTAGLVEAGTRSAIKQLTTKSAQTYTPTTTNQTIASGRYLTGTQTIKGDANLIADNIKKDVSIFGVTGTLETDSEPTLQSKTVSPTSTAQTVKPDSGYDGLSQVTVNAISSTYVGSRITRQAAKTITPGTSNQTAVAANRYTTGAITVVGDADLVAGNIKKGVSIFGVTGTYESTTAAPNLQSKFASPATNAQIIIPDSGYDGLSQVTINPMPTATQATPSITVNSSGLITASATQTAGYVSAGTKSGTKQLTVQAAKTVTPTTTSQTAVASGRYTTGAVTVAGDANLMAANIKSGVSIFNVAGTLEGLPNGISKMKTGTFTFSSDQTSPITIQHELNATPNFLFITIQDTTISSGSHTNYLLAQSLYSIQITQNNTTTYNSVGTKVIGSPSTSTYPATSTISYGNVLDSNYSIVYANTDCKIKAGATYCWIVGVADYI